MLVPKRVRPQAPTTQQPTTPSKKDARQWHWGSPGKKQPPIITASDQPLPSLLSRLAVAFSPNRKAATTESGPSPSAPADTLPSTAPTLHQPNPAPAFNTISDFHHINNNEPLTSDEGEEADPDEEDGIHRNYHHVRIHIMRYKDPALTFCSLRQGLTNSFSLDTLFWPETSLTNKKLRPHPSHAQVVLLRTNPHPHTQSTIVMTASLLAANASTVLSSPTTSTPSITSMPGIPMCASGSPCN